MAAAQERRRRAGALIPGLTALCILSAPWAWAEPQPDSASTGPVSAFQVDSLAHAPPGDEAAAAQFQVRRAPNPRYRPPIATAPGLSASVVGRLRALDEARAQIARRGTGLSGGFTLWDLSLGETYREQDAIAVVLAGEARPSGSYLRTLRVQGRSGPLGGALGDLPTMSVDRVASLNRLRGASLRYDRGAKGPVWSAFGGGPSPLPGRATPRLGTVGVQQDGLRIGKVVTSAALLGYGRGPVISPIPGSAARDSLPGRGGAAYVGFFGPLPLGSLRLQLTTQMHNLDGRPVLAALEKMEWSLSTRSAVLLLSEERAGRGARAISTEGFTPAVRREDRWNLQARPFRGRVEAHVLGVVRSGGDPALASQTYHVGASGNVGSSPWYTGCEYVWDWRGLTGVHERRLMLQAGRVTSNARAVSARLERTTSDAGRSVLLLAGEASMPAGRGVRVALEPRASWDAGLLREAAAATRITWPLASSTARITATLAFGAAREDAFRGTLREASIAISFAPRLYDRANLEVRSLHEGAAHELQTTASYDLTSRRFDGTGAWPGSRDSSRIDVSVTRSGNGTGVGDVLVSLDGKDLRFTDADGVAHFDRVPVGVHVVAIEDRSLPQSFEVVGSTRVFVTVERGVPPDAVRFTIARPERRTLFVPGGN